MSARAQPPTDGTLPPRKSLNPLYPPAIIDDRDHTLGHVRVRKDFISTEILNLYGIPHMPDTVRSNAPKHTNTSMQRGVQRTDLASEQRRSHLHPAQNDRSGAASPGSRNHAREKAQEDEATTEPRFQGGARGASGEGVTAGEG